MIQIVDKIAIIFHSIKSKKRKLNRSVTAMNQINIFQYFSLWCTISLEDTFQQSLFQLLIYWNPNPLFNKKYEKLINKFFSSIFYFIYTLTYDIY